MVILLEVAMCGTLWSYEYNGHSIVVKNDLATELYVDNVIQDRKTGISLKVELSGKLETGEIIKVSLGGIAKVSCNLFVNNVLQTPISIQK